MDPLLKALTEAFGPSGNEEEVRDILISELEQVADGLEVDTMGNLLVHRKGESDGPKGMIAAHMDEIGLIIDHVDDDGLLYFKKVGGIDDRVLPSTRVKVGQKRLPGVIGVPPKHLEKGDANEVMKSDDLFIDIGARSKEEALEQVGIGEYATFDTKSSPFGANRLKGKAFDDRAGCYMAAKFAVKRPPLPLDFAFTAQEEVGLRGAQTAAFKLRPDFAIVLEATTCADMPDPNARGRSTRLGGGPVLTFQDATSIPHRGLTDMLVKTAEAEGIPYQWKQTTAGGNDAGSIHKSREGVPTVSLSLPCRYIHSPCSVLATSDLEHTQRLLESFVARIAKDGLPS